MSPLIFSVRMRCKWYLDQVLEGKSGVSFTENPVLQSSIVWDNTAGHASDFKDSVIEMTNGLMV